MDHTAALAADGLAMLPGVLEPELASELLQHVDQRLALERLAIERSQCRAHMETLFGRTDRAQRAIYFLWYFYSFSMKFLPVF